MEYWGIDSATEKRLNWKDGRQKKDARNKNHEEYCAGYKMEDCFVHVQVANGYASKRGEKQERFYCDDCETEERIKQKGERQFRFKFPRRFE